MIQNCMNSLTQPWEQQRLSSPDLVEGIGGIRSELAEPSISKRKSFVLRFHLVLLAVTALPALSQEVVSGPRSSIVYEQRILQYM